MSEFGIKIKKISAGILYDVNLGVRDSFPYKDAMLTNSLFLSFIRKNGLTVFKRKKQKGSSDNESTRDLICLDFDFGSRSYEKELAHLQHRLDHVIPDEARERIEQSIQKAGEISGSASLVGTTRPKTSAPAPALVFAGGLSAGDICYVREHLRHKYC